MLLVSIKCCGWWLMMKRKMSVPLKLAKNRTPALLLPCLCFNSSPLRLVKWDFGSHHLRILPNFHTHLVRLHWYIIDASLSYQCKFVLPLEVLFLDLIVLMLYQMHHSESSCMLCDSLLRVFTAWSHSVYYWTSICWHSTIYLLIFHSLPIILCGSKEVPPLLGRRSNRAEISQKEWSWKFDLFILDLFFFVYGNIKYNGTRMLCISLSLEPLSGRT